MLARRREMRDVVPIHIEWVMIILSKVWPVQARLDEVDLRKRDAEGRVLYRSSCELDREIRSEE